MADSKAAMGEYIWIKPIQQDEFELPRGCKVIKSDGKKFIVQDDDGKDFTVSSDQVMKSMHLTSIRGVEDMITLGELQEYAILKNLHMRYKKQLIYTYTGSMLVAINPYEILPIYTGEQLQQYQGKKIGEKPPHIFAIGDACYREMKDNAENQCIVISGESGAGKTESTKLILQYLAMVSGKHSWIEQQIQETNPILEAFGNAKTVRNDNSSRFGKYIHINFSNKGTIDGAKIEQYLLEKSRIVSQNLGERNYHIFYCLLAGLSSEEKKRLELSDASNYEYLKGGKTLTCETRNDSSDFKDVRAAMKVLNFSDEEIFSIFQLLAAILHMGNVKYKSTTFQNLEACELTDGANSTRIASMLGVNKSSLTDVLTKKTIKIQGEQVITSLSKQTALETRDSFVKGIYGQIFVKIVERINNTIYKHNVNSANAIGVLDIFGFENFTKNSFEQLCINYANENLQQFFVKHIFKMEQEEYTKEGIKWVNIQYVDNHELLQIIGIQNMNIMSLIDEESKFPKGTDLTMLSKLHSTHGSKPIYLKPKSDHTHIFGVKHFAGNVFYDVEGFLDKNRDSFSSDIRSLIKQSSNTWLKDLFGDILNDLEGGRKQLTLSTQFRTSLDSLMKSLYACHPFFIRCIKPNELKKPKIFDHSLCVRQLRYAGMMETAHIRCAGFPIRHTFYDFVNRYRILANNIPPAHKGDCKTSVEKICKTVLTNQKEYQIGHTKVFLKDFHDVFLEETREKMLEKYILLIQRNIKRWIYRRRFLQLRAAAIVVQKRWRARGYRQWYLTMKQGYLRMQASIRSRLLTAQFHHMKKQIVKVQDLAKGHLIRKMIKEKGSYLKKQKLLLLNKRDEEIVDMKNSGVADYERKATDNYEKRVNLLFKNVWFSNAHDAHNLPTKKKSQIDVIDDVFKFLQDSPDLPKSVDQNNVIALKIPEEKVEDLSEYDFRKFAATYFTGNSSYQYSRRALKQSLLEGESEFSGSVLWAAARALWTALLRFMGDLPEPRDAGEPELVPVMTKLIETIGKSFASNSSQIQILNSDTKTMTKENRQKLINMTLKRQNKIKDELRRGFMEDEQTNDFYEKWLNSRRTTNLEKLHFIIGHGILRPELRDEIYCQLCKQLSNNPSKPSHARGWILMSLYVGCFAPSDRFVKYLRAFIRSGPPGYAPYCEGRLNRTLKNGARTQPPSWIELQTTKSKTPISLSVTFMDNSSRAIEADSASTAEEICHQIAENVGIVDTFGFSIFINLFDKVLSLGSESDHIMDAISQCEQYAKEQGGSEKGAPWKLYFRKEIFSPWHNPVEDSVATSLIFHQIVRGVKYGEYRCNTENDIAMIAAQQYYIEYGKQMDDQILHKLVNNYVPNHFLKAGDTAIVKWENLIKIAFKSSNSIKSSVDPLHCKEDIVIFAKLNWPILFSRFFEAIRVKGSSVTKDNIIIAVNWTGIFIVDDQEQMLLELSYVEITNVKYVNDAKSRFGNFILQTIQKEELVFQSMDAQELNDLVVFLIDGLKKRSLYVIAQNDYKGADSSTFLTLKKGDLITLVNDCNGDTVMTATWGNGECNGVQGLFPTDQIYILPTMTMPPQNILSQFKKDGAFDGQKSKPSIYSTVQRQKMHTLQKYSQDNFRSGQVIHVGTVSKATSIASIKKSGSEELWRHSRELIRMPLLQKLQGNNVLCKEGCTIYTAILKYMGDIPAPRPRIVSEYTDEIFAPALKHEPLKDEVYCQIMKQLTNNKIQLSEERGWELFWLITGLFPCSQTLLKEVNEFLKTRPHPIAKECVQRLFKIQKCGQRQYTPYLVEVEAIQHRSMQIYHKIYFPDDTDEAFEVESTTKAKDLCLEIAERLSLKNYDGFSLFVKIADKVFSVPENYYFFDFVHELIDWMKQSRPSRNAGTAIQCQYQLFFMKKLWINTNPGKDENADEIFYFPQELPKFLRGYHKCDRANAVNLAALIYRSRYGNDKSQLAGAALQLQGLLPPDLIHLQSVNEWRKQIIAAYTKDEGKSPEQAKGAFLKSIYQWPTFGTAFFEVKQTTDSSFPEFVIIAINKNGVSIIHPQNKEMLATYPFSELSNWSSGNTFFHMTLGNFMRGSKILCETSLGYKMDDLISSYITYFKTANDRK